MDIYFLGTGAGMPTTRRNVSSMALRLYEERGSFWMFDCGEGTQHQVLRSPLKLGKCEFIFITHLHGDHLFGLPGLLSSRAYQGGVTPLTVFGPKGLKKFIHTVFAVSETQLPYELRIKEIEPGIIWSDDQFTVTALPLEHRVLSYGYRVQEKDRPGKLKFELLQQKGIPPGPMYGKLKRGEDIELPNGELVFAASVVGAPIPGRSVAILGDTRPCDNIVRLARNVDLLVHEATFLEGKKENAHDFGHSTAKQAATAAKTAQAKKLALTHFSSRYKEDEVMEELLGEAREVFPNTVLADEHAIITTT
ncbi:ribonuclease Z [Paenibacillus apiarius]|uniref:Ribonuclease Z n=1 Tax=Paenibacillus apiarius TaxID=46240 RepID=A0ABT4DTZ2_9BACL|nr:ribonuclease Z [Paenibacillus apiarius]MCY9515911.1 ribonuclease Z [Paenibacillus apiarius]MCY9520821.1 ribonuclease Z [Paenibacillus apiarius]MCY9553526.1 ribonuclease Z [Paenibacillus apiarius]MCY9557951.1 ribonuclease Z [Paenibacillus apiarius]MCY9685806.1 ribonuclease Z [Paenibacillus apiarius]